LYAITSSSVIYIIPENGKVTIHAS
jgi:hypothetical protein